MPKSASSKTKKFLYQYQPEPLWSWEIFKLQQSNSKLLYLAFKAVLQAQKFISISLEQWSGSPAN